MTKLTLSIRDPELISRAKEKLKSENTSISEFLEKVLKLIVDKPQQLPTQPQMPPWVQELAGSLPMPEETDFRKEFTKKMTDKYGT